MDTENIDNGELQTWTTDEVADAIANEKIVLIDVRTPAEYAFEHVEGAMLLPMAFFDPKFLPGEEGKTVVLMCGSSARSGKMARKALMSGRERIAHLDGGFVAWKKAGQPYITTDMASGAPVRKAPD
jgi:rhodanese-related sulfurtransferase